MVAISQKENDLIDIASQIVARSPQFVLKEIGPELGGKSDWWSFIPPSLESVWSSMSQEARLGAFIVAGAIELKVDH